MCGSQQTMENSERHGNTLPDHFTCLLRNQYAGQEGPVRTWHGKTNWFKIGKGIQKGYALSPCFFKLFVEYIMQNSRLDKSQARIKIAERNVNNFRYEDDNTFMEESGEEQKRLFYKSERGEWKS